jgi:hypothetical protein
MSSNLLKFSSSAIVAAMVLGLVPGRGPRETLAAPARADVAPDSEQPKTTGRDQVDLSVTVYNSNIALIRDVRQIHLQGGVKPLRFEDVAASINPATVHFRSLTEPAKVEVVEQNFEYDLLDPQKLLQKYVGREVSFVWGGTEVKAQLLSDNNGPVWKIGNEIVTGVQTGTYHFPDVPANLYSRPTLVWTLDNRGAEAQKVEASYLASNINWSADYVLTVGRDEKSADLNGWVTLTNNTGAAFENAKLQLVAGQLHRTDLQGGNRDFRESDAVAKSMAAAPQFQQENFSEYHLYTLGRRTSIENNESKQISLLAATSLPVEKYLAVDGQPYYYRNPQGIGNAIPQPVKDYYRFQNEEKSGLGMPLPAGTVRVYQSDSQGGTQFAGEDRIEHTPKDETLRVYIGDAFDVVCERKQTDYKRLAPDLFEMEYQITLRNHKDGPVNVEVREPIGGDWDIVNSNYRWTKLDATTVAFSLPVEKNGAATLDYRVRVKW